MADSASDKKRLEKRSVVSNFIIDNHNPARPRVALFRRSDKVRTYEYASPFCRIRISTELTLLGEVNSPQFQAVLIPKTNHLLMEQSGKYAKRLV